ncbi:MAG: hypothetical protein WAW37_10100 [Syntrophobacteraceae bacterium]
MKKGNKGDGEAKRRSPGDEKLSRRSALKRIAAVFTGGVVGAALLGRAEEAQARYISIEGSYVNTVYVDKQYVNRGPTYKDYVSFYSSSRATHPPPPPPGK